MKREVKKAQSVMEFLVMFGALLFFFVVFMAIINADLTRENREKQSALLQNAASDIRDEISLAAKATDGYSREFFVAEKILGTNYELNMTEGYIFATTERHSASYKIFNVTGEIKKGKNIIKKANETIYLNQ
ncbi:hypothetical protein KAR91_61625 [Candidatus Pacearchaeota archaeon]|nr:hypothetical protein [Candidatus Pacearchaeota archaeon]